MFDRIVDPVLILNALMTLSLLVPGQDVAVVSPHVRSDHLVNSPSIRFRSVEAESTLTRLALIFTKLGKVFEFTEWLVVWRKTDVVDSALVAGQLL